MSARGRGRGRGRGNIPIVEEEVSSVGSRGHSTRGAQDGLAAPAPVKFTSLSRDYIHLGGVKFDGSETIIVAQRWLTKLEWILLALRLRTPRSVNSLLGSFTEPQVVGGSRLLLV